MRTSTDTTTWTTVNSNFGDTTVESVAYGNGLWVAGGRNGQMRTSTDTVTWTTQTPLGSGKVNRISYGKGIWVASIDATTGYFQSLRTSTNAITWTTSTIDLEPGTGTSDYLAYGNNLWVIVGTFDSSAPTAWISTNGTTWDINNIGTERSYLVGYGNGLWISPIRATRAGVIGTKNPIPTKFSKMINPAQGESSILASSGRIFLYDRSIQGWDQIDTGISDNFIDGSVSDNGIYHIVGENAVYTSTNLTTWTTVTGLTLADINDIISK
jgi:hypothetical protein